MAREWERARTSGNGNQPTRGGLVLLEELDLHRYNEKGLIPRDDSTVIHPWIVSMEVVNCITSSHSSRSACSNAAVLETVRKYALHCTTVTASSECTTAAGTIPPIYGALRPGGPVDLFSRTHIGLLLNWTIVGFLNGSVASLPIPLFGAHLGFSQVQVTSVSTLLHIASYFKPIFGFLCDNYAINRQRRKPYMFIGYMFFAILMVSVAFHNTVPWYGTRENVLNADAPNQGGRYFGPLMVSSFACLLVTVALEGMMVEFSHREGEKERGGALLWCTIFRFTGEISGGMFTTLGLASEEYGGTFASAIPLAWFFTISAVLACVGIVTTHLYVQDDHVSSTSQSFASNIRRVWRFLEQRVTAQITVVLLLLTIVLKVKVVEYSSIFTIWFHTSAISPSIQNVIKCAGMVVAAAAIRKFFLGSNWRTTILTGLATAFVISFPIELLTVWGVVRSNTLFLTKDAVAGTLEAIAWIVRVLVAMEASEPGLESTSYGFFTTVGELCVATMASLYNIVSASWDPGLTDLASDTDRVRWHITYEAILKYAMRFSLLWLVVLMLPRQKAHVTEIKICGASNLLTPVVLFAVFATLFVVAILSAVLAVIESTSCLPFAGGTGCGDNATHGELVVYA